MARTLPNMAGALWEARISAAKRERNGKKSARPAPARGSAGRAEGGSGKGERGSRADVKRTKGSEGRGADKGAAMKRKREGDGGGGGGDGGGLPPKRRLVSGPMCDACGVRFSGVAQLLEHQ
eukprot:6648762-Prymnesium_polylepis.1